MDRFFEVEDAIFKLHQSLKKFSNFKVETKERKAADLKKFKRRVEGNCER